jgi:hypothetical protein
VKARRHSSARREGEDERKGEKERRSSQRWFEVGEGALSKEGWLKYYVGLKDGALVVRFGSTDSDSIERTAP